MKRTIKNLEKIKLKQFFAEQGEKMDGKHKMYVFRTPTEKKLEYDDFDGYFLPLFFPFVQGPVCKLEIYT